MRQLILCAAVVSCGVGQAKSSVVVEVESYLTPTSISPVLEVNHLYLFEVTGAIIGDTVGNQSDAEWYHDDDGQWYENSFDPRWADESDLLTNEVAVDWWGTTDGVNFAPHVYSPSHVYRYELIGSGEPASFRIEDGTGNDKLAREGGIDPGPQFARLGVGRRADLQYHQCTP